MCGEALIDFTPLEVSGDTMFVPRPGGSPCNVAVGLARLGKPTAFIGKISRDRFGDMISSHLTQNGVDVRWLVRGDEPSALAFVIPETDGGHAFAFYGSDTAEQSLKAGEVPDSFAGEVTTLHFGSYSLMLGSSAHTYEQLMRRECGSRVISLDPNVRPSLYSDRQLYRERIEDLLHFATLVKVSQEDLAWLYPDDYYMDIADRWLSSGPLLVAVTLGSEGAVALSRQAVVNAPGVRVDVADTVGAGDAFTSALLARLDSNGLLTRDALGSLSSESLEDAISFRQHFGSDRVYSAGCGPTKLGTSQCIGLASPLRPIRPHRQLAT